MGLDGAKAKKCEAELRIHVNELSPFLGTTWSIFMMDQFVPKNSQFIEIQAFI